MFDPAVSNLSFFTKKMKGFFLFFKRKFINMLGTYF